MAVGTVSSTTSDTWQLISSQTPTSGTSVSFTSISGYKTLMMAFKGVTTAANSYMIVRSINSGPRAGAIVIYDADKEVPHKMEKTSYDPSVAMNPVFYTNPVAITRIDLVSRESQAFTAGTVYLYGIAA
jgi:type 1 fimbria pilin